MNWDYANLADDLIAALYRLETSLQLEQAIYGLDMHPETAIQELLFEALRSRYEPVREMHYPSSSDRRRSYRQRCDLVLTPLGRPLSNRDSLLNYPDALPPDEALWLEIKLARQFREGGLRHGGYGTQWRRKVVADMTKMAADPLIRNAGLVLIVFNESDLVLEKDLQLMEGILADNGVLAGSREVRSIPIQDRIGHTLCSIAIWPTIQR